jgi:hypothetical protein
METPIIPSELESYWQQLDCGFKQVQPIFAHTMPEALAVFSPDGLQQYLDSARFLGKMGHGAEPIMLFMANMPATAKIVGEETIALIMACIKVMWKSPNGKAIPPFLQNLHAVAQSLQSAEQMRHYLDLVLDFMERSTGSVHGIHKTFASPGLPDFLAQAPLILTMLSLEGLRNWIEYGVRYYNHHPERQIEYFTLKSADSRAVLQRERHGTLLVNNERKLDLYMRALWQDPELLIPYSLAFDQQDKAQPYFDALGIRLPDVYDDANGVTGMTRYRAALAHIAAHRRWSRSIIADNFSPFQRNAIEILEDSRVEFLAMREYPGLRATFMALHPVPAENAVDYAHESGIRHRLTMLSRAILDPQHPYKNPHIIDCVRRFNLVMAADDSNTAAMADIAISFIVKSRMPNDSAAQIHFTDTEVDYRDDNRHLWQFIEEGDEEETYSDAPAEAKTEEITGLPPRHYPEWDYSNSSYRPDWASVYERVHPSGKPAEIDALLAKHAGLAKRLKKMLDLLKPQDKVRIRYQEEGSELDLDVAIRSLIDYKSGAQPDPRINMSHRNDGRNIAVMLLVDLSESLNQKAAGCNQTILELSQEAVAILSWAVAQLGDPFAIAGFHSNTRHDVRYLHIKGFSEDWGDEVKGRIAGMEAEYSTRMGAAMRHAGHYLGQQQADKKLLLVLTDGEPADIDSHDAKLLIQDAHMAVQELDQQGIYSYCINLDPKADEYVADIFGKHYTIVDKVEQLPERLPELFISLTK